MHFVKCICYTVHCYGLVVNIKNRELDSFVCFVSHSLGPLPSNISWESLNTLQASFTIQFCAMYVQLGYFSHTVAFTFSMDGPIIRLVHNEFMKMTLLGPKIKLYISLNNLCECHKLWKKDTRHGNKACRAGFCLPLPRPISSN